MSQFYLFPPGFGNTGSNASVGVNGAATPPDSTLIGGKGPGNILIPVAVDASGNIGVNSIGGATAANQVLEIADLDAIKASTASIDTKFPAQGAALIAASIPVNIASNQTVPVSAAALPLPTNAAKETGGHLASIDTIITARLTGSLVPTAFDEVDLTYVPSGPGAGQIQTAVYKLAAATVKTLTLTYDGSDRLSTVVAS